jgi:hypothetical protein
MTTRSSQRELAHRPKEVWIQGPGLLRRPRRFRSDIPFQDCPEVNRIAIGLQELTAISGDSNRNIANERTRVPAMAQPPNAPHDIDLRQLLIDPAVLAIDG